MVLACDTLFLAGTPGLEDRKWDTQSALDAHMGKQGGLLLAVSASDGNKLAELKLNAPPVFDGLIAAAGRLYLAGTDGYVLCLNAKGQ